LNAIPVVILAGGQGTRLAEHTESIPKPMVPVGNRPILWHIMKIFSSYGFRRFILCLGYKGECIKDYFLRYRMFNSDFTVDLGQPQALEIHSSNLSEDWRVTMVDTGQTAMTGSRVKRIAKYIDTDQFLLTYGDGVADVDIAKLLAFHRRHGKLASVTGVSPPSRFGEITAKADRVIRFGEKPVLDSRLINGGFFVFRREALKYFTAGDGCVLEQAPLRKLAAAGQLRVFRHRGFWQCMDTMRDLAMLEKIWKSGNPPWKVWQG